VLNFEKKDKQNEFMEKNKTKLGDKVSKDKRKFGFKSLIAYQETIF
jgi:hypothetical protein